MSERDMFSAREHWLEETYFRKLNEELIEKLHLRRESEADRAQIEEETGIHDPATLLELQKDGYTHETIALLTIVPLVEVAWVEGGLADRERERIFQIARSRKIAPGSKAYEQLAKWMETKPSDHFFEDTLHAINQMFEAMPPERRQASRETLIAYCNQIAETVSGGILGRGGIGEDEQALIAHIAEVIGNKWKEEV
jgi:hypothetical protein